MCWGARIRNTILVLVAGPGLVSCGGGGGGGAPPASSAPPSNSTQQNNRPDNAVDGFAIGGKRSLSDHDEIDIAFFNEGAWLFGTLNLPKGTGPFPAVVFGHGSGPAIRIGFNQQPFAAGPRQWVEKDVAFFSFDKRGAGQSGGVCCELAFSQLARDIMRAIRALTKVSEIDATRIGVYGFSQSGWIVPIVAAEDPTVKFTVIGGGPTVTVGEEITFSNLISQFVNENTACFPSPNIPLTTQQAAQALQAAGPSGFNPQGFIRRMTRPGYWFYGERDASQPVEQDLQILADFINLEGKPFTVKVYPDTNHNLFKCGNKSEQVDVFPDIWIWLQPQL